MLMLQSEIKLTPVMVLEGALEILLKDNAWTQKAFARDGLGEICSPNSEYACCFCIIGAMRKVCGADYGAVLRAMQPLIETIESGSIPTWQDDKDRSLSEVLSAIRTTIVRLKNETTT